MIQDFSPIHIIPNNNFQTKHNETNNYDENIYCI